MKTLLFNIHKEIYNIGRHDPYNPGPPGAFGPFYPETDGGSVEERGTGKGEGFNINIPFCGPEVI